MQVSYERWQTAERYYLLYLQQNLFGQWEIWRCWGSRRTSVGNSKIELFPSQKAGEIRLEQLQRERAKKGYFPCL